MFMRNRLARKMAAEMRGATCAGTQTSKAPTLSGPSVTNHYSVFWGQHCSWLSTIYFSFHASHKARVFRECENKNMKIFTSVASIWYVEDSKIDFKNENTAHGNRLLLFYKSKIIEIEKDEYFSDNCKKYSHCSTNSKPNSAYCSSSNSHCEIINDGRK